MASGRRDYTWGFLNESATEGRYTESFSKYFYIGIPALDNVLAYTYTVPAGYKLGVNRIILTSTSGVPNLVYIKKAATVLIGGFLNGNMTFDFSDSNPMYFSAGEVLNIQIYSNEYYTCGIYGYVIGALEQLT